MTIKWAKICINFSKAVQAKANPSCRAPTGFECKFKFLLNKADTRLGWMREKSIPEKCVYE